jgi:hypothetical protein
VSGYTPVFKSVFTGTLCGQYPDTAAWLFMLALADKHGVVDMTPHYISSVTGMPVADLTACIEKFMQPDPYSRTMVEQGRRLVLLDPERQWGWRIVNFHLYREKARLQAKDAARTESGKDAERKREERMSPDVPRTPPDSPVVPLSDADADTSKKARKRASRLPEDFSADFEYARRAIPDLDADAEFARFRDYWRAKPGASGTKADWPATWRNWIRTCTENGKYARASRSNGSASESREMPDVSPNVWGH